MLQGRNPLTLLLGAFLACCAHVTWAVPQDAQAAGLDSSGDPTGYISVVCGDQRLLVHLDDRVLGECPLDSIPVGPGSYLLRGWPLDDRKFTSIPVKLRVLIREGLATVVDLSSVRWVRVETEPFGAHVSRDGVPIGETPVTVPVLQSDLPLIVEREGFKVTVLSAESLLSGPSVKSTRLEPAPGKAPLSVLAAASPQKSGRFGSSTLLTGIAAVGAATAAVVLKTEADDAFAGYKRTGDLGRMNELFERAERLDGWAVTSWIVSEVALGVFLYQLLREKAPEVSVDNR